MNLTGHIRDFLNRLTINQTVVPCALQHEMLLRRHGIWFDGRELASVIPGQQRTIKDAAPHPG